MKRISLISIWQSIFFFYFKAMYFLGNVLKNIEWIVFLCFINSSLYLTLELNINISTTLNQQRRIEYYWTEASECLCATVCRSCQHCSVRLTYGLGQGLLPQSARPGSGVEGCVGEPHRRRLCASVHRCNTYVFTYSPNISPSKSTHYNIVNGALNIQIHLTQHPDHSVK